MLRINAASNHGLNPMATRKTPSGAKRIRTMAMLIGIVQAMTSVPAYANSYRGMGGPPVGRSMTALTPPAAKHALLIGVSQYDAFVHGKATTTPLFGNLDSGEDIKRIAAALTSTFGFDAKSDITVLDKPDQTTGAAILAAFDKLVASTSKGDIVYIHYSGHGSQVIDKTKPSGLEETIVPADYNDEQTNEITGIEIRGFLNRLAGKHPKQIVLTFDCCHSGTISRNSSAVARGVSYDNYSTWYKSQYNKAPTEPKSAAQAPEPPSASGFSDLDGANYVVISACDNDSSAYETDDNGAALGRLSYCLSQVYAKATPETTYAQLFDQVRAMFLAKFDDQTPQIDGNPNTRLLGGTAVAVDNGRLVTPIDAKSLRLDSGGLQGVTIGSTYAIYASSLDGKRGLKIGDATVSAIDLGSATLKLDKSTASKPDQFVGARAVETSHHYPASPLVVDAASIRKVVPQYADDILAKLKLMSMVKLSTEGKADIALTGGLTDTLNGQPTAGMNDAVFLVRQDTGNRVGHPVTMMRGDDFADQIVDSLRRLAQYRYAMSLSQEDPSSTAQVSMRIIPADTKSDPPGSRKLVYVGDAKSGRDGHFQIGDAFTVEVTNRSQVDMHIAVLDLDSDGTVDVAWPRKYRGQDNIIRAGETKRLWREGNDTTQYALFKMATADPSEVFKVIATDVYVDFNGLANNDPQRTFATPLDTLFKPAITGKRDGDGDGSMSQSTDSWATSAVPFSVE